MWSFLRAAAVGFLLVSTAAQAQETRPWEEYNKIIARSDTVAAYGPDLFGDSVDLSAGALSFSVTDASIPGNSKLPVTLTRTLSINNRRGYSTREGALADWDLDIPNVSGVFASTWADNRCTSSAPPPIIQKLVQSTYTYFYPEDYWHGTHAQMPGGGELLWAGSGTTNAPRPSTGGPYNWVTNGLTYFSCLPQIKNGSGEGFLAITTDGTRYWFDWMAQYQEPTLRGGRGVIDSLFRRKTALFVTRIEDRFGNWVTYSYNNAANAPSRLSAINSSDGRQLTLGYNAQGHVASVTNGSQTWQYEYSSGALSAVVLPDTTRWQLNLASLSSASFRYFTPAPSASEPYRDCFNPGDIYDETPVTGSVTHPSGVTGQFTVAPTRFGRSNVPMVCLNYQTLSNDPNDDSTFYPVAWDNFALVQKQVSGPGLSTQTWNYNYFSFISGFNHPSGAGHPVCGNGADCSPPVCTSDDCAGSTQVTVDGPGGEWAVHTFGNSYRYNEGKLVNVQRGITPGVAAQTDSWTHVLTDNGQCYSKPIGKGIQWRGSFVAEYLRPQVDATTARDGTTYQSHVNQFDCFGRPQSVARSNSLGYAKTDLTEYHDDLAKWVVGQVKKQSNAETGIVVAQTDYDANALPQRLYSFGKLQSTLGYNADGTLASVVDGRLQTTGLSQWKRGIPQRIQHPDLKIESAVVDDLGWIRSVTNELGHVTCYGYDAMGRVNGVTYPSESQIGVCDTSTWLAKAQTFVPVAASEYGLPAGHWKQTVSTGDARRVVYFDALWRPVVEESLDATNAADTRSITVKRYDANGRLAFQSYPLATLSSYATANTGTRTSYDVLDRVTRVEQDSELGVLATTTSYLSSLRKQVQDPRGGVTVHGYMAFDQPAYDLLAWSQLPEGKVVEITRHPQLTTPEILVQRSADNSISAARYYTHDTHRRLCVVVEPETGATVTQYDDAGNVAWTAAGLTIAPGTSCDTVRATAYSSGRRVDRTYHERNWLKTLTFADGNGDQVWAYTADGLPSQVTTQNSGNAVVNSYVYNARRLQTGETQQHDVYTWSIGQGYDALGNRASMTYPGGLSVSFSPNALGQPRTVVASGATYASGVRYYPNGAIREFTYGNGILHAMTQNARQMPSRVTNGAVVDYGYTYDGNGNVAAITDYAQGSSYNRAMTYDGLDRLKTATSAAFGGDGVHRFGYDALDNLKSWTLAGVKDYAEYFYDPTTWRLTNIRNAAGATVVGLGYDVQGNLANKNGQVHTFDHGNRLRTALGTESYRYDAQGRRILTQSPSGKSFALYGADGALLWERDERVSARLEYVYLGGSLLATRRRPIGSTSETVYYYHNDELGSQVALTDAAGAVAQRSEYDPFGALTNRVANNRPGYTGHVMDAPTGLTYMQQRYYDPTIGRFLSVDPVMADGNTGGNFNRYKYASNNPYRFTDPDGRMDRETRKELMRDRSSILAKSPGSAAQMATSARSSGGGSTGGHRQAGSVTELAGNIGNAIAQRTDLKVSAGVALGSGAEFEASRPLTGRELTLSGDYALGAGAGIFGGADIKLAQFRLPAAVDSFVNLKSGALDFKVGAVGAIGTSLQADVGGRVTWNVFLGVGLGGKGIAKMPVTLGVEKTFNQDP